MTGTKICERCQQEKPSDDFFHKSYCRECGPAVAAERRARKRERSREWARNNPEKVKASARKTYEKMRYQRLDYFRRWRKENREKTREYSRRYQEKKQNGQVE
jgi:hypothetical protein